MGIIGNVMLDDMNYCAEYDERYTTIEEDLMKYMDQYDDPLEILSADNRWPILYHISPIRKNILDWYDFVPEADILEIGAECGILTEVLCRKAGSVTCIEPSLIKSKINAFRNKNFSNLKIIVSDFYKADLKKQYDYVVLIGNLDKVISTQEQGKKVQDVFDDLYKLVKKDGKVLFAVQNKFGLKYWAGYPKNIQENILTVLKDIVKLLEWPEVFQSMSCWICSIIHIFERLTFTIHFRIIYFLNKYFRMIIYQKKMIWYATWTATNLTGFVCLTRPQRSGT